VGLLARREYASHELSQALIRKGYTEVAIAEALAQLTDERLLDDIRYAQALVRTLSRRGQGPIRIRQALGEAGITAEGVESALESGPDFLQLAGDVRRRRFGDELPADWPEKARQMRFLQYRGFSSTQISAALAGSRGDSELEDDA
jgi:regulatory protein